jgi:thiol:disulfide interchange protein
MQKARKIPFLLAALFLFSFPAYAQIGANNEPLVKVTLIAENDGVVPSQNFTIGIRQDITPEWHTYWVNPGDTGLATSVKWELPEGATASELKFPTPHKQPTGDLLNYGYSDTVTILSEITPPAALKKGDTLTLKGTVSLLVCKEICIPEKHDVSLELPVVEQASSGAWASLFSATRKLLPQEHQSAMTAKTEGDKLVITIAPLPIAADEMVEEAYFYPHDGLLIQHPAKQQLILTGRKATLTIPTNHTRTTPIENVTGDLWLRNAMEESSYHFTARVEKKQEAAIVTPPAKDEPVKKIEGGEGIGFLAAIFSAFLAGIILNLMPCVFPVLSLKALGLVHKAQKENHRDVVIGGLVYLAGVLATFTVLGIILIALRQAGHQIGWGVQLQSPEFVAAVALLLFFIGLVLMGFVTIGASIVGAGSKLADKSGHVGSFFTGALAVVVATPCTAPFMGAAVFYGLTQAAPITVLVLWALGFGLALPYLLLTWFPDLLLKHLPRPGIWMEHFKQFLAFPMWAAAVWLVWVLAQQTGAGGVLHVLGAALFLSFGLWLWKTAIHKKNAWAVTKRILAVALILFAISCNLNQPERISTEAVKSEYYESYSPARLAELRASNTPVFVNMTAAWCITCLANEKAALATDKVRKYFKENGIIYLKGDWTNFDSDITAYLKSFGRSGVPIYVFYPAGAEPVVLPQILTPDTVIENLSTGGTEK